MWRAPAVRWCLAARFWPASFVTGLVAALAPLASFAQEPALVSNVVYQKIGDRQLKLDYVIPPGEGPYAMVVCFHGGGNMIGNKAHMHPVVKGLARAGFAAATVEYRFAPAHKSPAQVEDAKSAVRYLRSKAKELRLDPERFAAAGMSAGGAIALALAATEPADGVEGTGNLGVSSRVQCAVNYFGPCDPPSWRIADKYNRDPVVLKTVEVYDFGRKPKDANDALNLLLEANYGTSDRNSETLQKASVLRCLRKSTAPVLTLQGTADPFVPVEQARLLDSAMKKAGASHELVLIEGAGHGFKGADNDRASLLALQFLIKQLGAGPTPK